MYSGAKLSPKSRGISDIDERAARLESYENWGEPTVVDFEAIVGAETWAQHWSNWDHVQESMRKAQLLANEIREKVANVQAEL